MNKDKKNRSGSLTNPQKGTEQGQRRQVSQPGAPARSNRQTGEGRKADNTERKERDSSKNGNAR